MRLGVLSAFPPEGATVQELAAKVDGDADLIRRLMAHAATFHVFHQTAPGHFVHTASSKVLVENEYVQARLRSRAAEAVPATTKVVVINSAQQGLSTWREAIADLYIISDR